MPQGGSTLHETVFGSTYIARGGDIAVSSKPATTGLRRFAGVSSQVRGRTADGASAYRTLHVRYVTCPNHGHSILASAREPTLEHPRSTSIIAPSRPLNYERLRLHIDPIACAGFHLIRRRV